MSLLEEAIHIAVEAHRGQMDRAGQPYILHPLRIMCRMQTEPEKIVAVLHDVVEDTDLTLADLKARGFPDSILHAVDCLTKRKDEPYETLVARAKGDPLARRVKLGDLEDNMDVRRLPTLTEKDLERLKRYRCAWESLVAE